MPPLDLAAVERLVVYHLDEAIATPIAVAPEQLHTISTVERFETTDPEDIRAAYDAACKGDPAPDHDGLDVRWGVLFLAPDCKQLLAAYIDRFGVQGALNGGIVCFAHPTFLRWLHERFSA